MDSNYQGLPSISLSAPDNNRVVLRNRSPGNKAGTSPTCKKSSHSSLPAETVEYLKAWMMSPQHISHPYPTDAEKATIMAETGIEIKQLTNWFVNNRKRFWKPRVEAAQKHGIAPHHSIHGTSFSSSPSRIQSIDNVLPSTVSLPLHNDQVPAMNGSANNIYRAKLVTTVAVSVSDSSYSTYSSDEASVDNGEEFQNEPEKSRHDVNISSSPPSTVSINSMNNGNTVRYGVFHDEEGGELINRCEVVDVHILQPFDNSLPAIKDVTILSKVQQSNRILISYLSCKISYSFSKKMIGNRKKIQSRRDAEVVRIKKFYLRTYLASLNDPKEISKQVALPTTSKSAMLPMPPKASYQAYLVDRVSSQKEMITQFDTSSSILQQHDQVFDDTLVSKKRKKLERGMKKYREWRKESSDEHHTYADMSANAWKNACKRAKHGYCDSLPSLEEAAQMFGYVRQ